MATLPPLIYTHVVLGQSRSCHILGLKVNRDVNEEIPPLIGNLHPIRRVCGTLLVICYMPSRRINTVLLVLVLNCQSAGGTVIWKRCGAESNLSHSKTTMKTTEAFISIDRGHSCNLARLKDRFDQPTELVDTITPGSISARCSSSTRLMFLWP